MNLQEAKELFKKNIYSVEIGIHNYCNRTCAFCPLSREDVNRRVKKNITFMTDEMYLSILNQLAEIDFEGRIDFTRYHEPLADKEAILEAVRAAKRIIQANHCENYEARGVLVWWDALFDPAPALGLRGFALALNRDRATEPR